MYKEELQEKMKAVPEIPAEPEKEPEEAGISVFMVLAGFLL